MHIKELLYKDNELDVNSLYEIRGGVLDASDNCITFDGITWRDARSSELESLYSLVSKENIVSHSTYTKVNEIPILSDEVGYNGATSIAYREDVYMSGIEIGFQLWAIITIIN